MTRTSFALGVAGVALFLGAAIGADQTTSKPAAPSTAGPILVMDTVKGVVEIQTATDSPQSVARIVDLVKRNFYRGQRLHFVQPYAIQFGDPNTRDVSKREFWGSGGTGKPIGIAEPSKGPFGRGAVGLAYRANDKPTQADSQLFILKVAQPTFPGKYALIGRVSKGMEIVDKLEAMDVIKYITVK